MIRPRAARWFEALVARDDTTLLLEALAATGAVELEARAGATLPDAFATAGPALARFADFRTRYGAWWPTTGLVASRFPEHPATTLARGLERLDAWAREAEATIRLLERNTEERDEALRWHDILTVLKDSRVDLGALAHAGPLAQSRLLAFAPGPEPPLPAALLVREITAGERRYAIVVGGAADVEAAERETVAAKGRCHPIADWLTGNREANLAAANQRLSRIASERADLDARLEVLNERHGLRQALGDLMRLQWVIEHVQALESGDRFAWVTGWTSDREGTSLAEAVDRSGARALIHFSKPPALSTAPLLFANPRWARPFELFPRALGVPGATEADPTVVLAIAVPLIFGYMFGDVGQGLVIAAIGLWLRKRSPVAKLFVAGGLSATAFGWVFGSVFSLHGVVAPLWTAPLAAPIAVLSLPIGAGAILLGAGLLLHALGSYWRGEWARLLGEDLGLLALYAGILGLFESIDFQWLALAGGLAFVTGHAVHAGRLQALGAGLGELVERTLQLLINTLSFARVGAFALAHAGLSSAVSALMAEADNLLLRAIILVLGNVLIVVIEVMVVSIQTTRLVLFEFFARFLTGAGRPFRPLEPPPTLIDGDLR
ncbi:MAG: ATPase [Betaproteobacteria bacterium]|nr:ATPase [Betaproteobacteria bacterium]